MNAVIYLDVPDWQIGQDVTVYFPDTMVKHCKCELLKEQEEEISKISNAYLDLVGKASKQPEIVRCKDCRFFDIYAGCGKYMIHSGTDWFCADGYRR